MTTLQRATLMFLLAVSAVAAQSLPPGVKRERVFPPKPLPEDAVAEVNGQLVDRDRFITALVAEAGEDVLRKLVKEEVIGQAAREAGVFYSAEAVEIETQQMVKQARDELAERVGGSKPGLEEVLQLARSSMEAFLVEVRRQARLQMQLESLVILERLRMERVEVRMMQLRSEEEARDVLHLLSQGAEFGKLARKRSVHKSSEREGSLPPFARGLFREEYSAIEDAAFGLESPGQVSAIVRVVNAAQRGEFFLLQLIGRHPARTGSFTELADTIADLRRAEPPSLEELDSWMQRRMDSASIFVDPK